MSFPVIDSHIYDRRALFSGVEKIEKSINAARIWLVVNETSINNSSSGDVNGMYVCFFSCAPLCALCGPCEAYSANSAADGKIIFPFRQNRL